MECNNYLKEFMRLDFQQ